MGEELEELPDWVETLLSGWEPSYKFAPIINLTAPFSKQERREFVSERPRYSFPALIKICRTNLRETQEEFARRFSTHQNTVSRWESGEYQAPYEVIEFVLMNEPMRWQQCPNCNGSGRVFVTEEK